MTCGRPTNPHEVTVPLYRVPIGESFRIIGTEGIVDRHAGDTVDVRTRIRGSDRWHRGKWLGMINVKQERKVESMKHVYMETQPGSGQFKYRGSVGKEYDESFARAVGKSGLRVMVSDEPIAEVGGLAALNEKHVVLADVRPVAVPLAATEFKPATGKGK